MRPSICSSPTLRTINLSLSRKRRLLDSDYDADDESNLSSTKLLRSENVVHKHFFGEGYNISDSADVPLVSGIGEELYADENDDIGSISFMEYCDR